MRRIYTTLDSIEPFSHLRSINSILVRLSPHVVIFLERLRHSSLHFQTPSQMIEKLGWKTNKRGTSQHTSSSGLQLL